MRRFSYDLLSIPEFFKDDALIDHSYKSYNPQIGPSLKILKCVLMCRASSGKLVSGFNMIQQFQSWQSWPRQDSGHGCRGYKIWTPSFLLRISFIGPDSLRSFQAWKVGNRHHIFPYLHIRFLYIYIFYTYSIHHCIITISSLYTVCTIRDLPQPGYFGGSAASPRLQQSRDNPCPSFGSRESLEQPRPMTPLKWEKVGDYGPTKMSNTAWWLYDDL